MTATVECATRRYFCSTSRFPYAIRRIAAARPQSQPAVLMSMLHRRLLACVIWQARIKHRDRTMPVPPAAEIRSIGLTGAKTSATAVATIDVTGYHAANLIRRVLCDSTPQVRARTVT